MRSIRVTPVLSLLALCTALTPAQEAPQPNRERAMVDGTSVPVTSKAELTFQARNDEQVQTRQLWYRQRQKGGWGTWQQHPLDFGRNTPITWQPAEGHWQVYVRIVEISGAADLEPAESDRIDLEFIVDRTGPQVELLAPSDGTILSTGAPYTIRWELSDPNLHSTPVTLLWARDDQAQPEVIATGLPDSGEFKWTTPIDMSNQGRLLITAVDKVLNSSNDQSSKIIVDGVPPHRSILGPSTSQSREVAMQVRVADAGPARQVASVQLWHSVDGGATWTPGPKVQEATDTIAWTAPNDGEYQLSLIAADVAGNTNSPPTNAEDALAGILIDSQQPIVRLATATGVQEVNAPADGSTRRVFKPGDQVEVRFSIDDMRLAPNPVSVHFQPEPEAPWQLLSEGLPADQAFTFGIPDINSNQCRVRVRVQDAAGNVGEVVSQETFIIDNKVEHVQVQVEL